MHCRMRQSSSQNQSRSRRRNKTIATTHPVATPMTHELRPRRASMEWGLELQLELANADWGDRLVTTFGHHPRRAERSLRVESEPFLFAANLCMFFLLDTCLLPCGSASVWPSRGQLPELRARSWPGIPIRYDIRQI